MTDSLGRMLSAPLVYVLAEVRSSPTLDVAKRATAIQEAIKHRFPVLDLIAEMQATAGFSAALSSSSAIYSFTDVTKHKGVVVSTSSLSYHATRYVTSDEFFEELNWLLKAVEHVYSQELTIRLGLRYVDLIVPKAGETPFQYVRAEMAGAAIDNGAHGVRRVQSLTEYPRPNGGLSIRFMSLGTPLFLPPDLLPWGLSKPEWVQSTEISKKASAILDTDNWIAEQQLFQAENILANFKMLKEGISDAFGQVVTKHALQTWNAVRE